MAIEKRYSPEYTIIANIFRIGQTGVDLFFVISGFIMAYISYDTWGSSKSLKFIMKRLSRIYPVYWFYFLVTFSVYLVMPNWVNRSQGGHFNLLSSIFLLPSKRLPLVMVAWSLVFEFYFYLVFSILIRFQKKVIIFFLLFWSMFLIIFNLFFNSEFHYLILFYTSPYSLEFIIGIFVFLIFKRLPRLRSPLFPFIIIILSLSLIYYSYFYLLGNQLIQVSSLGISFGLLLLSCIYIEEHFTVQIPKILVSIGDSSYSIYLSHLLIINGMAKLVITPFYSVQKIWASCVFIFITVVIVVVYSYISYLFLERVPYKYLSKKIDIFFKSARLNESIS